MSKETEYRAQLEALGIWDEAFAPALHQLCILERELSRAMKQWKATAKPGEAPSVLDDHYETIQKLRRDILANRDSLGLTPKSYLKLKKAMPAEDTPEASTGNAAMAAILDRFRSDASAPSPAPVSPASAAAVFVASASLDAPASPAPAAPAPEAQP